MQTRLLTMHFEDHDGNPLSGRKVWVTASTRVYDTQGHVVLEPIPVIMTLNLNGYAERDFLCSDSDGINPTGWTYRLTPSWKNARPIDFKLVKGTGSVSIDQIGSVPATTGAPIVTGPQGPPGPVAITVSSTAPTNPVLNQLWLQVQGV